MPGADEHENRARVLLQFKDQLATLIISLFTEIICNNFRFASGLKYQWLTRKYFSIEQSTSGTTTVSARS